jgi:CheY-like chemotaxis protein
VAEDDPISRRMLVTMLGRGGFKVVAVEDGLAALKALQPDDTPELPIL